MVVARNGKLCGEQKRCNDATFQKRKRAPQALAIGAMPRSQVPNCPLALRSNRAQCLRSLERS